MNGVACAVESFFTHVSMGVDRHSIDADVSSNRFALKIIFRKVGFHSIQLQYFYVDTLNPQKSMRKRKQNR